MLHEPVPVRLGEGDGARIPADVFIGHGRHRAPCCKPDLGIIVQLSFLPLQERQDKWLRGVLDLAQPAIVAADADDLNGAVQRVACPHLRHAVIRGAGKIDAPYPQTVTVHGRAEMLPQPIPPDMFLAQFGPALAEHAGSVGRRHVHS